MTDYLLKKPSELPELVDVAANAMFVVEPVAGPVSRVSAKRLMQSVGWLSMEVSHRTGTGTHVVNADDYGSQLVITAGGPLATAQLPNDAPEGAMVALRGLDCRVTLSVAAGGSLHNWQDQTSSAAAHAPLFAACLGNPDGHSAYWVIDGVTA